MINKKMMFLMFAMTLLLHASVTIADVTITNSDKEAAMQLDQQAKQFIISGDFASALEKFQAAEIFAPDSTRAQRIEKIQSFVHIRKGINEPTAPETKLNTQAQKAAASPSSVSPPASIGDEQRAQNAVDAALYFLQEYVGGGAELIIDKDYQLKQVDQSFHADFDKVILRFDNRNSLDAGKLKLILKPDTDNKIHFIVKLNDTLTAIERDKIISEILIKDQDIQGIWNEQLEIFEDINIIFKNPLISIKGREPGTIRVDELVFLQKLNAIDTDNKWQQSIEAYLTNFQLEAFNRKGNREVLLKLNEISMNGSITGHDFERVISLRKELQKNSLLINEDLTDKQLKAILSTLESKGFELFSLLDFYNTSAALKGFSVTSEEGDMSVKEIKMGLSAGAKAKDKGEFNLYFTGSELDVVNMPDIPPGFAPKNIEFNLSVENFPSGIGNYIREMIDNPGKEEEIAFRFGQLLQTNNSKIILNKAAIIFNNYAMDMKANALANLNSPFLSSGEARLSILNFPAIIEKVKQLGAPLEVDVLLASIAMASVRTEQNGTSTDQFDLVWTADGKVLLNGKDAMPLLLGPSKAPEK